MDIFVYKDELSSARFRPTKSAIKDAISAMKLAASVSESSFGYEGRAIFAAQISEIQSCLSALNVLSDKLEQYALLTDAAPSAIIDADAKFRNVLSSGWDRLMYGISSGFGLFSTGEVSGKTGSPLEVDKTVEKKAQKAESEFIDNYRENNGIVTEERGGKYSTYSSKKTETVSILPGSTYTVTRYRDYKELSYSESLGDGFYEASAGLGIHGEHYEIEAEDGTAISIDTNALDFNLNGSLDPAKGNAYVNAGAEYNLVKANLVDAESIYHSASLSGQVGVGGHINAGIHGGKVTVDVSVAVGIGLNVKLEFNYLETWKHIRSVFRRG